MTAKAKGRALSPSKGCALSTVRVEGSKGKAATILVERGSGNVFADLRRR